MNERTEVHGIGPDELTRRIVQAFEEPLDVLDELRALRRELRGVYTADAVGDMLGGISAETVKRHHAGNGLPVYRPGKCPLFLREDVIEYVKQHQEG